MADGQVIFEITADGKHAIASIKDVTQAIDSESRKWDKSAQKGTQGIEDAFLGMAKKVTAGLTAAKVGQTLLEWGNAAIQAASDLQEVQNVVDVTFGEGASKIESWAKKAGSQFGLTETQAKKFTSTLGAMAKSAGLSGDEIIDMSTDLAGLAADMASFYNLDFETAFQKIRSGISGETEPLKQLGVNMSVANLEAFALEKGITKTFSAMTQGEQTLLRYQYLMQATADAQGDFARTSDGFANSQRRIQTAVESIKTSLGNVLMPIVGDATTAIAGFLEQLTTPAPETIFDKLNAIDIDTESKIADINATAEVAQGLIDKLSAISGTGAGDAISKLAEGANKLDASSPKTWSSILTSLQGVDGLQNIFSDSKAAGNVESLANALSNATIDGGKINAWDKFLTTLSDNAGALSEYTGQSESDIRAWIGEIAQKAKDLDPSDVTAWDNLFADLTQKLGITAEDVKNITGIEVGANGLESNSVTNWQGLFGVLSQVDGLQNVFGNSSASDNVESLADALSGSSVDTNKAEAWKTFLEALSDNADAVSSLTGKSVGETKEWLEGLAAAVDTIDPNDAAAWDSLLTTLASGLGGGAESQNFIEGMASSFLAMGKNSDAAVDGLKALGFSSEEIEQKQDAWLETCKDLVKTIPGLSEVINTETGEVTGGIGALSAYVDEWKTSQEKLVYWRAYYAKKAALAESQGGVYDLELDVIGKNTGVNKAKRAYEDLLKKYGIASSSAYREFYAEDQDAFGINGQAIVELNQAFDTYENKVSDLETATQRLTQAQTQNASASEEIDNVYEGLTERFGEVTEAELEAGAAAEDAVDYLGRSAEEWGTVTTAVNDAVTALANYVQGVHDATQASVNSTLDGFSGIKTAAQTYEEAANAAKEFEDELRATGKYTETEIEIKVNAKNAQVTLQDLTDNIRSQIAFIEEYQANLQKARQLGVSDDILASLSDGSEESALRLHAIVEAYKDWDGGDIPQDIKDLNDAYATLNQQKEGFTDTLTQQKLTVDDTYAAMLQTAQDTIAQMDLGTEAATASGNTVSGLATGITSHVPEVAAAVDSILAELNRLSGWGINIDFGTNGSVPIKPGKGAEIEQFETGLDFVPYDGFLASLHEGESILTAEENRIWQRFKTGGASSQNVDYDALGGVMRDNVKPGGNVYLDGRAVGQVVSQIQGNQYRSLQRSGWQQ